MGGSKIILGRRDRIDLPGMELRAVRAKIDTGAYGSAIHCSNIRIVRRDGKKILTFVLLDPEHENYTGKEFVFDRFRDKVVRSSSGHSEHRYSIVSRVVIFGKAYETEFSLTDRRNMRYPVLLGRKFLKGRFIVDVSRKDVSYKKKT